jgi:hypothetical protein
MTDTTDSSPTDEPVACTISDETRADRERFVRTELAPHVEAIERRDPDGWRFVVDDDGLGGVTTFARREHECCSFATFELTVTPGDADSVLAIHGPDGTDEMFRDLVDTLVAEFDVELRT